jgi:hypothetical protein
VQHNFDRSPLRTLKAINDHLTREGRRRRPSARPGIFPVLNLNINGLLRAHSCQAHNLKVIGSNPIPATKLKASDGNALAGFFMRQAAKYAPRWVILTSIRKIKALSRCVIL